MDMFGGSSEESSGDVSMASSMMGPWEEPTSDLKSSLTSGVHQCPYGRWMHRFDGLCMGEEGYRQQCQYNDFHQVPAQDRHTPMQTRQYTQRQGPSVYWSYA